MDLNEPLIKLKKTKNNQQNDTIKHHSTKNNNAKDKCFMIVYKGNTINILKDKDSSVKANNCLHRKMSHLHSTSAGKIKLLHEQHVISIIFSTYKIYNAWIQGHNLTNFHEVTGP